MIRSLPRVVAAPAGKPVRAGAEENQQRMQAIARDPAAWTPDQARDMVRTFDELAGDWDAARGAYRTAPLADALARGGPFPDGACVEIGSGTGLLTPLLLPVWEHVVCVDLTWSMLVRARAGHRVWADASALPVRSGSAAAVVVGDAPLFAAEIIRVLRPDGVVVWSNALGQGAPFYVPVEAIAAAVGDARWDAVHSEALWGSWAVFRRAPAAE